MQGQVKCSCPVKPVQPIILYLPVISALVELDVSFIESVLLAFPETDGEELTLEMIQPYWKVMEKLVHKEIALSLGLADLDKTLLEQLYGWAEVGLHVYFTKPLNGQKLQVFKIHASLLNPCKQSFFQGGYSQASIWNL